MRRCTIPKYAAGIYQIKSIINGKIYIGSSVNLYRRIMKEHADSLKKEKHGNRYLQRHVNKYGIDDLVFSIHEFCEKEKLIEREQFYIDWLHPEFNICKIARSSLGVKHTKKTRNNMSKARKGCVSWAKGLTKETDERILHLSIALTGIKRSEETKRKIGQVSKNRSEETRRKISEAAKGRIPWNKGLTKEIDKRIKKYSEANKGKNNPMFGKPAWNKGKTNIYSKETRKKLSNAAKGNKNCLGRKLSKATKRKISESHMGKIPWNKGIKHSEETRRKISAANKGNKKCLGRIVSEETRKKISEAGKKYWAK